MSKIMQDFHEKVIEHSLMPGDLLYNSNALAGEAGECCNNIKKIIMARQNPDWVTQDKNPLHNEVEFRKKLSDEIGDMLFYLKRLMIDNDISMTDVMKMQIIKLTEQSNFYGRTFLK